MTEYPKPTTANAVWIATALLHNENKDSDAFKANEIFQKVKDLELLGAADETLKIHISSHCVASGKASPDTHRKLVRVRTGWYRLFRIGDSYHPTRENGRVTPLAEEIPTEYRRLLDWYNNEYCKVMTVPSHTIHEETLIQPPFSRIDKDGTIKIPNHVLDKMNLQEGDYIAFIDGLNGEIILRKARVQVEVS